MATNKKISSKMKILIGNGIAVLAIILYAVFFHNPAEEGVPTSVEGTLLVHYVDVGQGDCILIQAPNGENMVIDAGTNSSESAMRAYLKSQNVKTVKYAVFTHPHEDHIGGADVLLNEFDVETVIMPDVSHTSKTFERMIDAIDAKNISVLAPVVGDTYQLGDMVQFEILGAIEDSYESLNNYSVVLRLDYGTNKFLFTGDAEKLSENQIMNAVDSSKLKSDVLKLGHHGSSSSSGTAFYQAVNPQIAIICCGLDNSYGHPHQETMQLLKKQQTTVYRTDKIGTIVLTSDGTSIQKIQH